VSAWSLTDVDREFVARHVEPYLPDRVFDAHAHLFSQNHYPAGGVPTHLQGAPVDLGIDRYREYSEWLHPNGRTKGGLFFGLAFQGDRTANDNFVADEVRKGQEAGFAARGQMLIAPEMDAEFVRAEVYRQGFVGLKPYHLMAKTAGPTFLAPIEEYLSEEHVRIAHEEGLTITLHMVRDRALADPVNQATIRRYCTEYPNMRLILAHAARGFNPWHTIEGIHSLQGLENVWCDTSAVTEAGAFEVIVETLGHEKLLYGTDFHVSHLRGRCVAIGDSFHWLYADEMNLGEKHTTLRPVLIGLESLRSVILAMHRLKLSDAQIEDIFYGNAARLLHIDEQHTTIDE
jgi:predicted TIM-barrel fold metal-dependent hydrolase